MTTDTLIRAAKDAGVALRVEGGKLKIRGSTEAIDRWTPRLREHKAALLAALTKAMRLELPALAPPALLQRLECLEQSSLSAMRQQLLDAADRICDFHGSTDAGRQSLRLHCKGIEPQFMQWWIDSYEKSYPKPL